MGIFITTPAHRLSINPQPAGVRISRADGGELSARWWVTSPPAGQRAVGHNSTGMERSRADGVELPSGRRSLSLVVTSPTIDAAIGPQTAGVPRCGADGGELPFGWCGGTSFIPTSTPHHKNRQGHQPKQKREDRQRPSIRGTHPPPPYTAQRGRYCSASARCCTSMESEAARSAMVRESFNTRWKARALRFSWFMDACSSF